MAAGCVLVIPVLQVISTQSMYVSGHYGNSVWDGYRILFVGVGMH